MKRKQTNAEKITITRTSMYGRFKLTCTWNSKEYSCITSNTMAMDRALDDEIPPQLKKYNMTKKQAYEALYKELKRKNSLGSGMSF